MLRIDMRCLAAALSTVTLLVSVPAEAQRGAAQDAPPPAVWLEAGPELAPGQPARLGYDLPRRGYLTILRASTDGDLSVVYPERPNSRSNRASRGVLPMRADGAPGVGYLFWVSSPAPFDFRQYAGRDGRWSTGSFAGRGDPFEAVDHFARGTTRGGRYSVGYSSYRVGDGYRGGRRAPAVHDGGYGDGYASGGYAGGYDGSYGYGGYAAGGYGPGGYGDAGWWGGPQWNGYGSDTWRYRRSWRDGEYQRAYDRAAYNDPRSRYLRHCADGTLAPYTVPCGDVTRSAPRAGARGTQRGRP